MKAIIPVRSGSKRVVNKNIRSIAGTTLLEHKIKQLLKVPMLDAVCVNSEDEEMLFIAKRAGAVPFKRDPYFASDSIPMSEVYANMVSELDCEDVLYATVTTPFITTSRYVDAINMYFSREDEFDSIHSTRRVYDFLIREGVPLNYNPSNFPRSQDLPDIQKLVFGFSLLPRKLMIEKKSSVGYHPKFLEVTDIESLDIDTELDFKIADMLLKNEKNT